MFCLTDDYQRQQWFKCKSNAEKIQWKQTAMQYGCRSVGLGTLGAAIQKMFDQGTKWSRFFEEMYVFTRLY